MHLNGLNTLNYSRLSDRELDNMYAAAVERRDNAGKVAAGLEIVQRLATPSAFFSQLNPFASTNFPKYRSLLYTVTSGMVVAPVASESMARSAEELKEKSAAAIKNIGSGAVIIAGSAALIALLIFLRKK